MKRYRVELEVKRFWFFSRKFVVDVTTFSPQNARMIAIASVMRKGYEEKRISVVSCEPTNAKVITKNAIHAGGASEKYPR